MTTTMCYTDRFRVVTIHLAPSAVVFYFIFLFTRGRGVEARSQGRVRGRRGSKISRAKESQPRVFSAVVVFFNFSTRSREGDRGRFDKVCLQIKFFAQTLYCFRRIVIYYNHSGLVFDVAFLVAENYLFRYIHLRDSERLISVSRLSLISLERS